MNKNMQFKSLNNKTETFLYNYDQFYEIFIKFYTLMFPFETKITFYCYITKITKKKIKNLLLKDLEVKNIIKVGENSTCLWKCLSTFIISTDI